MSECQNLTSCAFFAYFEKNQGNNLVLNGLINRYCKGSGQDKCKRKKVSKALGGPLNVPKNMMPNGFPLSGTSSDEWPKKVQELI